MDSKTLSGNAGSETVTMIVKIEGVGSVVFPASMTDAEVSQAAGRLYDDNNGAGQAAKLADQDTSGWRHIQTADKKHWLIHPEDLPKAQQRDPNLVIHDQ